jgi:hypothetical protein
VREGKQSASASENVRIKRCSVRAKQVRQYNGLTDNVLHLQWVPPGNTLKINVDGAYKSLPDPFSRVIVSSVN